MARSAAVPSKFLLSTARPDQFPPGFEREVAFVGRSNAGKSSLINKLTGQTKLAFTSSRPGCTRLINFYQYGEDLRLVDLPGYGFAAGPVEDKIAWKALIDSYLQYRQQLLLVVLVLDSRRGWTERDLQMKEWLEHQKKNYLVVATKVDKLNQKEYQSGIAALRKEMGGVDPIPFSALNGRGVREIWQAITKITSQPL